MIGSVSFRIEKQIRGVLSADDHPLFDAPDKGIPAKLAPIHVNGKHHLLLYRSCNPVVQLFDSTNDEHVSSFPILQRNYISRKLAGQSELPKRLLQQLCSNAGGNWLVAAVSRYDESVSLRFFQVTRNSLVETSFAESSHKKALSCLVFHPSQDICISGSVDGFFKVWKRKSVPQKSSVSDVLIKHKQPMKPKDEKYAWECVQVGTYKGLPVKDACFSRDGSLIVVVFGNLITFWSFASGSLKETVMIPKELESGKIRVFFHGNLDLICCTDRGLFCIDLLSLKSKWSIEKRILACEASQDGSRFAVCLMDDSGVRIEVFVDKGDQPFMTHAIQDSEYFGHRETWASRLLAFVRSPNGWALNVLVRNSSLVSLTADQETASMELSSLKGSKQSSSSEMQTLLQGSQGQKSVKNVSKQQVVAEGDFRKVLDGPAYALPSVTSLFQNAVAKLLGKTEEP
jgi:WD40 repeat protein